MVINNFKLAREALNQFVPRDWSSTQNYSLDRMVRLMDFLGNPQNDLIIIHIAGTSGKTSTAYYCAALLRQVGKNVGLSISPHITEINERLQINLVPLNEADYGRVLNEFLDIVNKSDVKPTYFEMLIALAYWHFARCKLDYAVIEVGLGGLVDGTNVIDRADKVCVLTDIGLDHIKILGSTLSDIATQKAGIITSGNKVFTHPQDESVMRVFENRCHDQNASLVVVPLAKSNVDISFLPGFQQRNFSLALAAVNYVIDRDNLFKLPNKQVIEAAKTHIPARMEIFKQFGKTIIIDGAHNAQKLHALIEAIKQQFPNQPVASLVSFVSSGEPGLEDSLSELKSLSEKIIITSFSGEQDTPKHSVETTKIVDIASRVGLSPVVVEKPEDALSNLLAQPEPVLVVTGSFYLLNHIRPLMLKS